MVFKRHYESEMMDDFSIADERINVALEELNIINKFLGGNSTSAQGIKHIIKLKKLNHKTVRILDIGSGGSDFFYKLKYEYSTIQWVSTDLNIQACRFDKQRSWENDTVCCNALKLPFKDNTFDIVHTSLFLHHFKENEILELLRSFSCIACAGLVINDLRRNIFAYLGIKLLTALFSRSEMVKNDGPISVKRGFVKRELLDLLIQAGIQHFVIKRKWAFRWMIIITKSP